MALKTEQWLLAANCLVAIVNPIMKRANVSLTGRLAFIEIAVDAYREVNTGEAAYHSQLLKLVRSNASTGNL